MKLAAYVCGTCGAPFDSADPRWSKTTIGEGLDAGPIDVHLVEGVVTHVDRRRERWEVCGLPRLKRSAARQAAVEDEAAAIAEVSETIYVAGRRLRVKRDLGLT